MINPPKITVPTTDEEISAFRHLGDEDSLANIMVTLTDDGLRIRIVQYENDEETERHIIDFDDETIDSIVELIDTLTP